MTIFGLRPPDLENQKINHPLKGSHSADVVIIGVGYSEGVPSTQTAGRIIAELMTGESNDFTNHYVVNQHMPYAGPASLRKYLASTAKWIMKRFDMPLYR